jgi:hypothetical protein
MADKIEREIEEILTHIEKLPRRPRPSRLRQANKRFWRRLTDLAAALPRPRMSAGQLMLLGGGLLIAGYIFEVGSSGINRWLIVGGLFVLLLGFVLSWRRGTRARMPERRWRGQPMELDEDRGDRLRSWWERWRSHR